MQNLEKLKSLQKQDKDLKERTLNKLTDTPKIQQQLSLTLSPQQLEQTETSQKIDEQKPIIIGICGGPSSGKVLFSETLRRHLLKQGISTKVVKQENFEIKEVEIEVGNLYDTYGAHDWKEFIVILIINQVESALKPQESQGWYYEVVIIEGTLIFANEFVRKLLDIKIFLDTDEDVRLSRRIYKDVCIKKRDITQSINRYLCNLKPLFERFIVPTKRYADIVIPNYGDGYSSTYSNEYIAGFATFDHAVIDLLTTNVKNHITLTAQLKETQLI